MYALSPRARRLRASSGRSSTTRSLSRRAAEGWPWRDAREGEEAFQPSMPARPPSASMVPGPSLVGAAHQARAERSTKAQSEPKRARAPPPRFPPAAPATRTTQRGTCRAILASEDDVFRARRPRGRGDRHGPRVGARDGDLDRRAPCRQSLDEGGGAHASA